MFGERGGGKGEVEKNVSLIETCVVLGLRRLM